MSKVMDSEIVSNNWDSALEYFKLGLATCAVLLMVVVVCVGISMQYCILQLPPIANFLILGVALTMLSYIEALHYGCVAVHNWDMSEHGGTFPRAVKVHQLIDTPDKLKKFLVGRQFLGIFVVFLVAQITTFPYIPGKFLMDNFFHDF